MLFWWRANLGTLRAISGWVRRLICMYLMAVNPCDVINLGVTTQVEVSVEPPILAIFL